MEANDLILWTGLRAGDKLALEQIYNRYAKALYNYGRKVCTNTVLVEDAIQDLFIDLWRYRTRLSSQVSVRFYLYAALRRKIMKEDQRHTAVHFSFHWDELNLISFSEETNVIHNEIMSEQSRQLKYNLNNLSPRQYEAIVLRFYDELSYAEIAAMMDVNEQSVRNLVQRGLEHLRQYARLIVSGLLFFVTVF
jgi:RNA polymerase sigma-70 factor (ECF subfamily)